MYFKGIASSDVDNATAVDMSGAFCTATTSAISFHDPIVDEPIFIRLADTDHGRSAARILLNRKYSWRGYGDHHEIIQTPSHTTFTASSRTGLLGTITLAVDSPNGLSVDGLFKDIIDSFRARSGASVCELTKFAFDTTKPSKPMLAALFHLIFIYGRREYGCTDLFIEVNPRHVRFYKSMLGFSCLGGLEINKSVAAPAQLMWLSVAKIREQIDAYAGKCGKSSSRLLYTYFFSPKEEDGLYGRMVTSRSPGAFGAGEGRQMGMIRQLLYNLTARANTKPIAPRRGLSNRPARGKPAELSMMTSAGTGIGQISLN